MSGICGIFNRDGKAVEAETLQRMVQAAAHLGPDGVRCWSNGAVGFAHLALHTTAESSREQQPLLARDGDLALVADARVDNRDELIGTLTSKGYLQHRDPTDVDLILAAYQAWGEGCPYHILGDFAFVLWDGREQRLFCARDPFGVRPLFYYVDGRVFLFGSMARQVLAHGAVPARLNERAIAYYLTGKPYNFLTEGTYFEGIWRVRPAHTLALTQSGEARQTRYWDIDRGRQLRYNSDQAYAEELLHLLEQAVKAQSRSQRPVAVLTSGGMDSSLVACLLGKLRQEGCGVDFQLVSFVYGESHSADERQYISHIATHCGTVVHYVDGLGHLPLSSSPYVGWFDDEPPRYWNDPLWHATFVQVAQLGCRVALLGQGGDSLFTVHHVLFADLLRQRRLIECVREIRTVSTQYRRRVMELICDQWARTLAPMWLLKLHRRLRRSQLAWVNKDFADPLTDVPDFKWGFPDHGFPSIHQAARYHAISDWLYPVEAAIHRLAVPHGLEPRDPYLYRPLVEFGLALPAEQIYRRGVTKWALRNASHGIVPEPIRLRLDKTTFDTVLRHGLAEWVRMGAQSRVSGWTLVRRGHVNAGRLSEALAAYGAAPTDRAAITLWKPLVLEQWLQFVQAA